jgi:PAS domain S-box-containing protein
MPTVPNIVNDPTVPRERGLSGWLREQPDRARDLGTIVAMLPDVVFKCEKRADGKIHWLLNEGKLAEEFGLTTDKIKGKTLEELFPPEAAPHLLEHFERCFAGEAHEFVNELGGRYFKHFPQPVFDADGRVKAVVGFISEVTNLKRAEEEIRRLNRELEGRVQELEIANRQLAAYSYSVSHDLRSPLTTISLVGDYLARGLRDARPEIRACVEQLRETAGGMDRLIEDILSLARATRGVVHREPVDLSGQADEVIAELRMRDGGRPFEAVVEPNLRAMGEPRLLRAVMENLLSNAWKYSRKTPAPRIEFRADPDKGPCAFLVRDNGVGFEMNQASTLFQAFERLHGDREFEGTGVGLATVRRIIVAHGGEISVESSAGQGATFHFSLGS